MKPNLFAYGFRPHFLLAGLAALLLVPLWALSFVAGTPLGSGWPPTLWHGHEMLFGFISCAIAGFLLTAVPSWTGQKGYAGQCELQQYLRGLQQRYGVRGLGAMQAQAT